MLDYRNLLQIDDCLGRVAHFFAVYAIQDKIRRTGIASKLAKVRFSEEIGENHR